MSKKKNNPTLLGKNLRQLRESRGETLEGVGKVFSIGASTLCNYESGTRAPNYTLLSKIAQYYGKTVDELIHSDLSGIEKTDFSLKNMPQIINIWETVIPLFKSDHAMNNSDFQNGYKNCRMIIDRFSKNETVMGGVIEKSIESFSKAAENGIPEAIANMMWIIFLEWSQIMNKSMADIFYSIFFPSNTNKNTAQKISEAKLAVSEDVLREKEKFIDDLDETIYALIGILKSDLEWAELGDFYLALKFLCGIAATGYSQEMNEAIGIQMLIAQLKIGNKYAFNFFKIAFSI